MITIIRPARAGKTVEAIKLSLLTGARVLCFCAGEAKRVKTEAEKQGIKIPEPLYYGDAL